LNALSYAAASVAVREHSTSVHRERVAQIAPEVAPARMIVPPNARPPSPTQPVRNILCPVDFTAGSVVAWCHALPLVQASQGLITLMHVLGEDDEQAVQPVRGARPRFLRAAEARARLGMAVSDQLLRSCLVRLSVESGAIAPQILEAASRHGIDLIVLGVPRNARLDGARLDDDNPAEVLRETLIAQAPCPVLLIPTPAGTPDWDAEFDVPGGRHQGALPRPYSLSASP
jgi:nucleotide-binding universal stress UspA family protein